MATKYAVTRRRATAPMSAGSPMPPMSEKVTTGTRAPFVPGTSISVTVAFEGRRFTVPAEVVYRDAVRGFGVRFLPSAQRRALAYAMGVTETTQG